MKRTGREGRRVGKGGASGGGGIEGAGEDKKRRKINERNNLENGCSVTQTIAPGALLLLLDPCRYFA